MATIITWVVRAILLSVLVLYHLSCRSLSPELLLLHYRLLSNQSCPNLLLLMHDLYSLKSLLCPVSSPHGILVGGMVHTSYMQLNVVPQSINELSNPLGLKSDQSLREARKLGEAELILINNDIILNKSLELPERLVSDVSWDELPEKVCPEGGPSCLVPNHLVRALHCPPLVLCYTMEHV